jgi:hypothetical protein
LDAYLENATMQRPALMRGDGSPTTSGPRASRLRMGHENGRSPILVDDHLRLGQITAASPASGDRRRRR